MQPLRTSRSGSNHRCNDRPNRSGGIQRLSESL
nr:MAG TPA: hypothetical protein [Caudoviricetes sp.]